MNPLTVYPALVMPPSAAPVEEVIESLSQKSPADSLGVIFLACDPVAAEALQKLPSLASAGAPPVLTVGCAGEPSAEQNAPAFHAACPALNENEADGDHRLRLPTLAEYRQMRADPLFLWLFDENGFAIAKVVRSEADPQQSFRAAQ